MLSPEDRAAVADRFGADDSQIERDHLISHLLVGLAELVGDTVVFFGGTALSRTHLPEGRLSEDIDLYTSADRQAIAEELTTRWPLTVRREYPRLRWQPGLADVRDIEPSLVVAEDGATVRVQLLKADATYARWPTERRTIEHRYSDVPRTDLTVPSPPAFVAMKAAAWRDRHTARDLFDLAALGGRGLINQDAVTLLRDVTGTPLVTADLERVPKDLQWKEQLAHQCRLDLDADTALAASREAWGDAAGW
jgi:predicted nucleotidyltransferase component of viral defense system